MGIGLLLAVALSVDGFGVGLSYGLRRIRLPVSSLSVITLCTILAMGISMLLGNILRLGISFFPVKLLGAAMMIALGVWQIAKAVKRRLAVQPPSAEPAVIPALASVPPRAQQQLLNIRINYLGLVIQVLRTPDLADIDGSGVITFRESILLGIALAVDAFISGMGAAMTGIGFSVVILVAATQLLMIKSGQWLAQVTPEDLIQKAEFLPGAVLIFVGLGKIM
ncbi:MAG: sporulation membrane protein YtaF [Peptococcaceae bacterium]|jgi:putative sporulation protein YtaF|nr:sporulation membrane protein YtaF [Peptococcaceae bacterium]